MTTPMTGLTPKMAGVTPNSQQLSAFGFSPSLLGQSPAAFLNAKLRSPMPGNFNSPGTLAAMSAGMTVPGGMGTPQMVHLPPDEKKKHELQEIIKLLATRPGRISETAIETLAARMGLECYKDTENGTTLSLITPQTVLDIDFVGTKIGRVTLTFEFKDDPKATAAANELSPKAASIFYNNLTSTSKIPGRTPLLAPSISAFAENLNRQYVTEKLSTSLNCFTAIYGIYQSLHKIYEYERDHMGGETVAMCSLTGRPAMHTRGEVGLSIDYWKERQSRTSTEERLWRVIIEVEETPPPDYGISTITPVRASNHWVSEEIKKAREDNLFGDVEELLTDWLDPPLEELLEVPGDPRLPTARFVARLDPPVVLPFQEEVEIYPGLTIHSVGRMDAILFPTLPTNPSVYRRVHHPEDPEGSLHRYTLHSDLKPVIARKVTEIPFSHPKDLLPIFRTLRQYALLTTLLESCFLAPGSSTSPPDGFEEPHVDELNTFLQDLDEVSRPPPALPVDITLEIEHAFGLRITAPGAAGGVENLQVRVGKNAELVVGAAEEGDASAKGVERALRACEDVGLVLAWMRRRKSEL